MKPTPILAKQPIVIRKPPRQEPEPKDDIWVLRSEVETKTTNKQTTSSNSITNQQQPQLNNNVGINGNKLLNENSPVTGMVMAQPRGLPPQPYIFSTPMSIVSATSTANQAGTNITNNPCVVPINENNHPNNISIPMGLNPANFPATQPHLISPTSPNPSVTFPHISSVTSVPVSYTLAGPPSGKLPPEPRPPPPPPPPRLTPVSYATASKSASSSVPASSISSSSMSNNTSSGSSNASSSNAIGGSQHRAENPTVAQNRLHPGNQGPAFHESPDEGYHEDEGGSETM